MTPAEWEKLLEDEGLGVSRGEGRGKWVETFEPYHETRPTFAEVMCLDKEEDDPVRVAARGEIAAMCARLPSKWAVILELRSRGLTQKEIGERLGGVPQSTICDALRRIKGAVLALQDTPPVTREQIEEWVRLTPRMRFVGPTTRADLVETHIRLWNAEQAAFLHHVPQPSLSQWLARALQAVPDHPVARLLTVERRHQAASRRRGRRRSIQERMAASDYSWVLAREGGVAGERRP